jgi:sortase B
MGKHIYRLTTGALLVAFAVSGGLLLRYVLDNRRAVASAGEARVLAERVLAERASARQASDSDPGAAAEDTLSYDELFQALRKLNPDTVAWLMIPDSEIRYPVVQAGDNDLYLHVAFDGKRNSHGAIFMDCRNQPFEDFNTIIYGHNMRDKTMFGTLADVGPELVRAGGKVLIWSEAGLLTWQVISARIVNAETELDMYGIVYAATALERLNRLLPADMPPIGQNDQILTLSTCASGGRKDYRYIVQARLIGQASSPTGEVAAAE